MCSPRAVTPLTCLTNLSNNIGAPTSITPPPITNNNDTKFSFDIDSNNNSSYDDETDNTSSISITDTSIEDGTIKISNNI